MKQQHITTFFISLFLCFGLLSNAQDTEENTKPTDSIKYKEKYGLRIGGDLSKIMRTVFEDDYTGFEINADYRITKSWYIAGELGTEEKTTNTDFLSVTANGSYFKAGLDYNMYKNWLGMENMIYGGFRLGVSSFSQTVNSYTIYSQNQYWAPQFTNTASNEASGLSAVWAEVLLGIKAEILNNLYVGINVQLKGMLTQKQPDGFENLFVPGFNKTYDSGSIGVGYGYNISYLIPLFKKDK